MCFSYFERGDFLKNSVVLDFSKMGCLGGIGEKPSPLDFACINLKNIWPEKKVM